VFNEHVPDIVDMRRYLVLTEGTAPAEAQTFFNNLEKAQNPWGRDPFDRGTWLKELGVPLVSEVEGPLDYLYWIGCAGAYDDRNRKVTTAVVKILQATGTRFAILGPEEKCNGEAARRLGNEYLFQTLRDENAERIRAAHPRRILVTCPHCFNTFKNEYGLEDIEVVHHAVFLEEMREKGKLPLTAAAAGKTITYHDPCYLGRYNDVYDQPRSLLGAVGASAVEMPRCREKGLCCGAGGGRMWLEEDRRQRVNAIRVAEALETGADTIATACPYCLVMLSDGLRERGEEEVQAKDVAELVADALTP
jgi:Fe-S oxidoreductase